MRETHTKERAEKMGREAFNAGTCSTPAENKEFIEWLPRFAWDHMNKKAFNHRIALYGAYVKGWHSENLKDQSWMEVAQ